MEYLSPQRRQARIAAISFLFYHQRAWTKCEELAGTRPINFLIEFYSKPVREQAVLQYCTFTTSHCLSIENCLQKRLHESD